MNKFYYALILLVSVGIFSCETDIDVNADFKDITVVYGLISPTDSVHYIKINKAFSGNENAFDLASNSDNFNYAASDLEVVIEEFSGSNVVKTFSTSAGTVIRTENEIPKDPGIFDNSSNILYKFIEPNINRSNTYKIKIINKELDKEIIAETKIVHNTIISAPSPAAKFRFFNGSISTGTFLSVGVGVKAGADVGRVEPSLNFNYIEHYTLASGKASTFHTIVMPLGEEKTITIIGGDPLDWSLKGETFFENIRTSVSAPSTVSDFSHRELILISITFDIAGTELSTFIEVNSPSTSVNQDKPNYTNINNGIGVFSSREKVLWNSSHNLTIGNIQANTISFLQSMNLGFCFSTGPLATAPCVQL
ncbi:MAG: hypothetical protein JKY30_11145 [Flavobacteriales bacterium]|nr:hypothetical protein [Flavobacteriales bacterium]